MCAEYDLNTHICKRHVVDVCRNNIYKLTFKKPIRVSLFGTIGFKKREDILRNVFHHPSGKSRILQIWDVLRLDHLIFLVTKMEERAVHVYMC